MQACDNDIQCLEDNRETLYRAAKEEVLAAYTCGLRRLKAFLHTLIIYGEKNNAFSVYSFWQIHRVNGIFGMNIEETREIIKKAEESLRNIRLADPDKSVDKNSIGNAITENDPDNSEFNSVNNSNFYEHAMEDV